MNGHLFASIFTLLVALTTGWLWADPDLRERFHAGEPGTGARMSSWSLGSWVASFLLFAGVEFLRAIEIPLPAGLGNGLIGVSFLLIVVGAMLGDDPSRLRTDE
ncbi:MAG TPA: hypothetical protein VFB67_04220 [Candidatus Polarisedimenticolaceae bacterium]|nr:hypothetical protein [Candidatus Polarisedimenticolaceae bacterium]